MIDPTLVVRKINLISQDLDELLPISHKDLSEYLSSRIDEILAERYLERMIGRMIEPRKVFEGLQAAMRNIPQYLAHIHQYLQNLPTD